MVVIAITKYWGSVIQSKEVYLALVLDTESFKMEWSICLTSTEFFVLMVSRFCRWACRTDHLAKQPEMQGSDLFITAFAGTNQGLTRSPLIFLRVAALLSSLLPNKFHFLKVLPVSTAILCTKPLIHEPFDNTLKPKPNHGSSY